MADDMQYERDTSGRYRGMGADGRGSGSAPRRQAVRLLAWTASVAVLLGAAGAGYLYFKLNENIQGVDINGALGTDRPDDTDNGSVDILVLGSDSRAGSNAKAGGGEDDGTARADTAMIVHFYQGHKKAAVMSIPRDTMVDRPSCTKADGSSTAAARDVMFNESYAVGGAACTVKTVESMTKIRMDHYIELDFSGFRNLIDALGGVTVTTSREIDDNDSHLHLKAGTHTLDGKQSLGLVRTRHSVGDGSDLGRIELQHAFIKTLMDRVNSLGLLTSPAKLYDVADTATRALTTDSDLASVKSLVGLAESMKGLSSQRVSMVTLPVRYDPHAPNRVLPLTSQAHRIWQALKADKPIPKTATKGSAAADVGTEGLVKSSS